MQRILVGFLILRNLRKLDDAACQGNYYIIHEAINFLHAFYCVHTR